jgi:hypothetical protein
MGQWPGINSHTVIDTTAMAENPVLRLDPGAMNSLLRWKPVLDPTQATRWAARWYYQQHLGAEPLTLMRHDIDQHHQLRQPTQTDAPS